MKTSKGLIVGVAFMLLTTALMAGGRSGGVVSGIGNGSIVFGNNSVLTLNQDSSLPAATSVISMNNTRDWSIVDSTGGTGSNNLYIGQLGDYQWGAHVHGPSTSVGSIGVAVGGHGLDGTAFLVDVSGSTNSVAFRGYHASSTYVGNLFELRAETAWQTQLYPSLTPSYSGTFSGNFLSFYDRSVSVFRVAASGAASSCDSAGTSCTTISNNGSAGIFRADNSKPVLLWAGNDQIQLYNNALTAAMVVTPGTTGTTLAPSAGPVVVVPLGGTASGFQLLAVATQTIADTNTIVADSCGGTKRITSAGSVTTNTTNTFTALSGLVQCSMRVCNVGAQNIILDQQAAFKTTGGGNLTLGANACVAVEFDGSVWRQAAAALTAT